MFIINRRAHSEVIGNYGDSPLVNTVTIATYMRAARSSMWFEMSLKIAHNSLFKLKTIREDV